MAKAAGGAAGELTAEAAGGGASDTGATVSCGESGIGGKPMCS